MVVGGHCIVRIDCVGPPGWGSAPSESWCRRGMQVSEDIFGCAARASSANSTPSSIGRCAPSYGLRQSQSQNPSDFLTVIVPIWGFLSIAQLEERRTVTVGRGILRSPVRSGLGRCQRFAFSTLLLSARSKKLLRRGRVHSCIATRTIPHFQQLCPFKLEREHRAQTFGQASPSFIK